MIENKVFKANFIYLMIHIYILPFIKFQLVFKKLNQIIKKYTIINLFIFFRAVKFKLSL